MTADIKIIFKQRHKATRFVLVSEDLGYWIIYCDKQPTEGTIKTTAEQTGYDIRRYGTSRDHGYYLCVMGEE